MSRHLPQLQIHHGDNLPLLQQLPAASVSLVYIDPPFNTGREQVRVRVRTSAADASGADRVGFGGRRYVSSVVGESRYSDSFLDYLGFLRPRLLEIYRVLQPNGSLFFHIDWREAARARLLLEEIFGGAAHCINELIWAYDYGARSKRRWAPKHDNIYWFAKNPNNYIFNYDEIDRIPYMAPNLVGAEKAARGKTPTDTWWHTIVPTNSAERTGYATQKPLGILERIVRVHSKPKDVVLDCFAGSGTTGEAALKHGRGCILMDESADAVRVMRKRLAAWDEAETSPDEGRIPAPRKRAGRR